MLWFKGRHLQGDIRNVAISALIGIVDACNDNVGKSVDMKVMAYMPIKQQTWAMNVLWWLQNYNLITIYRLDFSKPVIGEFLLFW